LRAGVKALATMAFINRKPCEPVHAFFSPLA